MAAPDGDLDVEMEDASEPLMQTVEVPNDHMEGVHTQFGSCESSRSRATVGHLA